mmetsp:Transcript_21202/g.37882  ORF Transcript_21202/g.37882 Transcript_21202/m.37882 type:complete len:130 (+) Transcript_21202:1389-1778(+)
MNLSIYTYIHLFCVSELTLHAHFHLCLSCSCSLFTISSSPSRVAVIVQYFMLQPSYPTLFINKRGAGQNICHHPSSCSSPGTACTITAAAIRSSYTPATVVVVKDPVRMTTCSSDGSCLFRRTVIDRLD